MDNKMNKETRRINNLAAMMLAVGSTDVSTYGDVNNARMWRQRFADQLPEHKQEMLSEAEAKRKRKQERNLRNAKRS